MAYTTSQLEASIAQLEASLASGAAEVMFEGRRIVYRTPEAILKGIGYFKGLLASATDTPVDAPRKIRTYIMYGGNGIGQ